MIFEPIGKEAQNERARQKVMFCLRCQCHQQVMFPFNKHHKQSICWFALCRHCPDRAHSPVFHVLVNIMTFVWCEPHQAFVVLAFFHFQNSSNMKVHEKLKNMTWQHARKFGLLKIKWETLCEPRSPKLKKFWTTYFCGTANFGKGKWFSELRNRNHQQMVNWFVWKRLLYGLWKAVVKPFSRDIGRKRTVSGERQCGSGRPGRGHVWHRKKHKFQLQNGVDPTR